MSRVLAEPYQSAATHAYLDQLAVKFLKMYTAGLGSGMDSGPGPKPTHPLDSYYLAKFLDEGYVVPLIHEKWVAKLRGFRSAKLAAKSC